MNFFRHFTVKKTSLPLPAERLSCLYIEWVAYMDAICKECLWIKCVFATKFLVYRGKITGSETVFGLIYSLRKQCSNFSLVMLKFCYLAGILALKVCLHDGAWRTVKTGACLLRFSALESATRLVFQHNHLLRSRFGNFKILDCTHVLKQYQRILCTLTCS